MAFRKGQKIVCVSEFCSWKSEYWKSQGVVFPVVNRTYTIRLIHECGGILLEEIKNAEYYTSEGLQEPNFSPKRFAPILYTSIGLSSQIAKEYIQIKEVVETVKTKEHA